MDGADFVRTMIAQLEEEFGLQGEIARVVIESDKATMIHLKNGQQVSTAALRKVAPGDVRRAYREAVQPLLLRVFYILSNRALGESTHHNDLKAAARHTADKMGFSEFLRQTEEL